MVLAAVAVLFLVMQVLLLFVGMAGPSSIDPNTQTKLSKLQRGESISERKWQEEEAGERRRRALPSHPVLQSWWKCDERGFTFAVDSTLSSAVSLFRKMHARKAARSPPEDGETRGVRNNADDVSAKQINPSFDLEELLMVIEEEGEEEEDKKRRRNRGRAGGEEEKEEEEEEVKDEILVKDGTVLDGQSDVLSPLPKSSHLITLGIFAEDWPKLVLHLQVQEAENEELVKGAWKWEGRGEEWDGQSSLCSDFALRMVAHRHHHRARGPRMHHSHHEKWGGQAPFGDFGDGQEAEENEAVLFDEEMGGVQTQLWYPEYGVSWEKKVVEEGNILAPMQNHDDGEDFGAHLHESAPPPCSERSREALFALLLHTPSQSVIVLHILHRASGYSWFTTPRDPVTFYSELPSEASNRIHLITVRKTLANRYTSGAYDWVWELGRSSAPTSDASSSIPSLPRPGLLGIADVHVIEPFAILPLSPAALLGRPGWGLESQFTNTHFDPYVTPSSYISPKQDEGRPHARDSHGKRVGPNQAYELSPSITLTLSDLAPLSMPTRPFSFMRSWRHSLLVPCNSTRAALFRQLHPHKYTDDPDFNKQASFKG